MTSAVYITSVYCKHENTFRTSASAIQNSCFHVNNWRKQMKWEPNYLEHVDTRRRGLKPDLNWLQIERELGRNLAKN